MVCIDSRATNSQPPATRAPRRLAAAWASAALLCVCCAATACRPAPGSVGADAALDASPSPPDTTDRRVRLRVLTANVGNLDEAEGGPCPKYHKGTQCDRATERIIAANLALHRPDIVVLNEVWDTARCQGVTEKVAARVCHDPSKLAPYQQARRYLGPGYTIVCDGIAHFDCIAARTARVTLKGCAPGGLCLAGATTPKHPAQCANNGSITSVSSAAVVVESLAFTVVNGHPLNAYNNAGDPCRLAQYQQIFEQLASAPRNLIMGDMNGDALRFPTAFASFIYWNTKVGPARRFRYHSGPAEATPAPPTWMNSVTLDYVLSDFASGTCRTLGHKADKDRLDHPAQPTFRMDHLGIVCDLWLPRPDSGG